MDYDDITNAANLPHALVVHFRMLADQEGAQSLLESVMARATGAKVEGNTLAIAFGDDDYHTLEAKPASGENVEGHWGDLFSTHGNFEFAGFQLLRGSGEVYFDDLDEEELEDEYGAFMAQLEGTPMSDVEVLVQDNSDFWVAHPHRQNSHSKPLLVCLGHDDPDNPDGTRTTDDNPGTHFLRKMAAVLGVS